MSGGQVFCFLFWQPSFNGCVSAVQPKTEHLAQLEFCESAFKLANLGTICGNGPLRFQSFSSFVRHGVRELNLPATPCSLVITT
jgi:hypothetical protein